ncbi:MAG: transposase [Erysipelotrichaceae bacterium]|nr:transposase [Erysipelotrichaceae bacterium]
MLDVIDEDSSVIDIKIDNNVKSVTITKNLKHDLVCPVCSSRLYSKGRFTKHPKNQILLDGYTLKLTVMGRRWICSNKECNYSCYDSLNFVEPRKQITKIITIRIIMELKDINLSCTQVAQRLHVSDSYVHQIFMKYVRLKRKPLTEYICIDEDYLNISNDCKYTLVITDSFHVLQWLLRLIRNYINAVNKRYQERDRKTLATKNYQTNQDNKTIQDSPEVYILKNAQWVLLMNPVNRSYHEPRYNHKLGKFMDTYEWENEFLKLDDNFMAIRNLKDLYESFNNEFANDLDGAQKKLDELIEIYCSSDISIFRGFAKLLTKYHQSIVNSFICVKTQKNGSKNEMLRRLSNGPMESFNNIPTALRRQSHGISNFEFARNRILWAIRDDAPINVVPLSNSKIHKVGKKRGPYKKNND